MRVDRDPSRPVRHLEWRVRLLAVGAILALAGMYFDSTWMVNVALAVLLVGFLLRFTPTPGRDVKEEAESERASETGASEAPEGSSGEARSP